MLINISVSQLQDGENFVPVSKSCCDNSKWLRFNDLILQILEQNMTVWTNAWTPAWILEKSTSSALQETYLCLPYRVMREWHNIAPGPLPHKAPRCLLHKGEGSRLTHDSGLAQQSGARFSALTLPLARCLQRHTSKAADTPVTWLYFPKCWDNGAGVNGN